LLKKVTDSHPFTDGLTTTVGSSAAFSMNTEGGISKDMQQLLLASNAHTHKYKEIAETGEMDDSDSDY